MIISPELAVRAVADYNAGTYRGQSNVSIDRQAYARFGSGVPEAESELVELLTFVGDDYGGAQRRFLPHGYREEASLIVSNLRPQVHVWRRTIRDAASLSAASPDESTLNILVTPFVGTKRWPVWASKTLHFFRPDVFPILDSRAKNALGLRNLGSSAKDYSRFCKAFYATLGQNQEMLEAARRVDEGHSPSDIKLLDKVLYQVGG